MVAFTKKDGPDIPEPLLYEHEKGRVVFFCGAGVSMSAGLPSFECLVEKVYQNLDTRPGGSEQEHIKQEKYDVALGLLERRYPGGRKAVRKAVHNILQTPTDKTATHHALLQLATDRKQVTRLVTTNFDRLFVEAAKQLSHIVQHYDVDTLPSAKKLERWDGIVHLHGLLPEQYNEKNLDRLILTKNDFGSAYLTDGQATRFVTALLQDYTVCFVGYSMDDPILHYIVGALADDRSSAKPHQGAYAFADFENDKEEAQRRWKTKGVEPLLYKVSGPTGHYALQQTLKEWAATHSDSFLGKEKIITQHASTPPPPSSDSEFPVSLVLWALKDRHAAKHFAKSKPTPPLEWIAPLSNNQLQHEGLKQFGVIPDPDKKEVNPFSFLCRPSPYFHAPYMSLVSYGAQQGAWDDVMWHLATWLLRHLGNPELILWVAQNGGQLHPNFARLIRKKIQEIEQLELNEKEEELDDIKKDSPDAIPDKTMRTLWGIALAGQLKSPVQEWRLHDCLENIKHGSFTPSLREEVRKALAPRIKLPPARLIESVTGQPLSKSISEYAEIKLCSDHANHYVKDMPSHSKWKEALVSLLPDFTVLLRDALDLMRALGKANDTHDSSYVVQPSISPHAQNTDREDWTVLIDFARDAWLATAESNLTEARSVAELWMQGKYPLFKRLAFFAATHRDVVSVKRALDWLLSDNRRWLWSNQTQREALRLLVFLAPELRIDQLARLESAILNGPPREMFREGISTEDLNQIFDRMRWIRLAKAKSAGASLSDNATRALRKVEERNPKWKLDPEGRDEFPAWIEVRSLNAEQATSLQNGERVISPMPTQQPERRGWIKKHLQSDRIYTGSAIDEWKKFCQKDFSKAVEDLRKLAHKGEWPIAAWERALQVWQSKELCQKSFLGIHEVLATAPANVVQSLGRDIGSWLQCVAEMLEGQQNEFFSLCRRVLSLTYAYKEMQISDCVTRAINHPVGQITKALLNWCIHHQPSKDRQELADEARLIFAELCDARKYSSYYCGRILLATYAVFLHRCDAGWTRKHLLPFFDWSKSKEEAKAVWAGFLWSQVKYYPLLSDLKREFLETATYHAELDGDYMDQADHATQYVYFFTNVALDPGEVFTEAELAEAAYKLPPHLLASMAYILYRALGGADDRVSVWKDHVHPFLKKIWPHSIEGRKKPDVTFRLAEVCIEAENNFPDALEVVEGWLQPFEDIHSILPDIKDKKICQNFPDESLSFLDAIIDDNTSLHIPKQLKECLDAIKESDEKLANDPRFKKLEELILPLN